ncbi:MAG: sugar ABC transporter permease, partial [Nocardioidaceae bacterium]
MSRRGRKTRSLAATDTRAAWLFISPWVVGFLLFTLYPLIYTGYLSFTDYDVINDPHFIGGQNYSDL